jgi:hypothetical protein
LPRAAIGDRLDRLGDMRKERSAMGDNSNKGMSKKGLQEALEEAGKNAAQTGMHTVHITVDVGNPKINEYKVTITPGG